MKIVKDAGTRALKKSNKKRLQEARAPPFLLHSDHQNRNPSNVNSSSLSFVCVKNNNNCCRLRKHTQQSQSQHLHYARSRTEHTHTFCFRTWAPLAIVVLTVNNSLLSFQLVFHGFQKKEGLDWILPHIIYSRHMHGASRCHK